MNVAPPPVDLSRLKGVLSGAKNVMKKVETGDFESGNVNGQALVQDTSGYVSEGNVSSQNVQSMGNPVRQTGAISETAINNSKLPDGVKDMMRNRPTPQAVPTQPFNLDDVNGLIEEKPIPAPSNPTTQRRISENMIQQNTNDKFTVSESALRGIIKDVLIEYLSTEFSKNLSESVIKKTINTLIKEGKIKK